MIYVFLAEGFEETEAIVPIDILRRGGLPLKTVGVTGKTVTSSHGVPITCDILADEIDIDTATAVILPGGMPGTLNLKNDKRVLDAVKAANERKIIVAAICAAPSVLGYLGILNGKNAVCYPGFENELKGAKVGTAPCVTDGNIVTARGAGAAAEFGFTLLNILSGEFRKIKDGMLF